MKEPEMLTYSFQQENLPFLGCRMQMQILMSSTVPGRQKKKRQGYHQCVDAGHRHASFVELEIKFSANSKHGLFSRAALSQLELTKLTEAKITGSYSQRQCCRVRCLTEKMLTKLFFHGQIDAETTGISFFSSGFSLFNFISFCYLTIIIILSTQTNISSESQMGHFLARFCLFLFYTIDLLSLMPSAVCVSTCVTGSLNEMFRVNTWGDTGVGDIRKSQS